MWNCVNRCMKQLLPAFAGWVIAVIVAAIIAAIIGTAGIGAIVVTAAIAIGAGAISMALHCYLRCR